MTIEFKTGNILDAKENLLAQQVNYQKVMSGGLAKQIRTRYPKIYKEYCDFIDDVPFEFVKKYGYFQQFMVSTEPFQYIINIFGQEYFGRDKCYTDYISLRNAFYQVELLARIRKYSVAIPFKIGCGLAGGDWDFVYSMIEDIFGNSEVQLVIYKLEGFE